MAKTKEIHIVTEKEKERAIKKAERDEKKRLIVEAKKAGKRRWAVSGSYRRLLPPGE